MAVAKDDRAQALHTCEEVQRALECRAATAQVPVREPDARAVEVQHERSLEGAHKLGRVHVAVDGVDGGQRGELVEHVLSCDVAGMQDTVDARERLPHRGRDHTTPIVDVPLLSAVYPSASRCRWPVDLEEQ